MVGECGRLTPSSPAAPAPLVAPDMWLMVAGLLLLMIPLLLAAAVALAMDEEEDEDEDDEDEDELAEEMEGGGCVGVEVMEARAWWGWVGVKGVLVTDGGARNPRDPPMAADTKPGMGMGGLWVME